MRFDGQLSGLRPFRAGRHRQPRRRHRHQPGHAQEGKLRPDVEQVDRIHPQHDQAGKRQDIEAHAAAAQVNRRIGRYDQHRCPHDGRLGIDQQHIENRKGARNTQPQRPGSTRRRTHAAKPARMARCNPAITSNGSCL